MRARVRAQLGLPDGATAVLYTPTWRDDLSGARAASATSAWNSARGLSENRPSKLL